MKLSYSSFKDEDLFHLTDFKCKPAQNLFEEKNLFKILWNKGEPVKLKVDNYELWLNQDEVIFCTPFNVMEVPIDNDGIVAFVFNKQFFCIQTHDDEVSCNGFLFFGSAQPQVIKLSKERKKAFTTMHQLFLNDFSVKDKFLGELLRTLLKRMLILSTRFLKSELKDDSINEQQLDLLRQYNILVEKHFKELHQVKDYAKLLFKSPKTLSNIFLKYSGKSPLALINERIILEAKRLILYSDKSNNEIAYDLGYKDANHFSKFFKKNTDHSPSAFKKLKISGEKN